MSKFMNVKAIVAVALSLTAAQQAFAFGAAREPEVKKQTHQTSVVENGTVDGDELSIENPNEGYALGRRNGGILVDRLKLATVGHDGCSAIGDLERALLKVARKVSAPVGHTEQLALGFYRGYVDAIRDGIHEARQGCDSLEFDDSGLFAGQLYGGILCSVSSVSLELASRIELVSLYEGWSGGKSDILDGCRSTLELTLRECTGLQDITVLDLAIQSSCAL